jgi:hypothetical protein
MGYVTPRNVTSGSRAGNLVSYAFHSDSYAMQQSKNCIKRRSLLGPFRGYIMRTSGTIVAKIAPWGRRKRLRTRTVLSR